MVPTDTWRYFSVFRCAAADVEAAGHASGREGTRVCIVFKDNIYESWVGGLQSEDGEGRSYAHGARPELVLPYKWVHLSPASNRSARGGVHRGRGKSRGGPDQPQSAGAVITKKVQMTHNLAISPDGHGGFLAAGGQYKNIKKGKKVSHAGVWLARGATWRFAFMKADVPHAAPPKNAALDALLTVGLQRSVTAFESRRAGNVCTVS